MISEIRAFRQHRSLAGERFDVDYLDVERIRCGMINRVRRMNSSSGRFQFFPNLFMANAKGPNTAQSSTKPSATFRLRGISASVFENHTQNDGRDVSFYKVSLQRRYRDGDEWKTSSSFSRDDVPVAKLLMEQAWQFILETEASRGRDETDE